MHKTIISVAVGIVLIGGIGYLVYSQNNKRGGEVAQPTPTPVSQQEEDGASNVTSPTPTPIATKKPASTPASVGAQSYSAAQVAAHNSRESCWSTINGNVYDLTSWIPKHPGGEEAILKLCGTDGSAQFNNKHGGGAQQAIILAGFKVGVAAQ